MPSIPKRYVAQSVTQAGADPAVTGQRRIRAAVFFLQLSVMTCYV
jgi:hypothetical protein